MTSGEVWGLIIATIVAVVLRYAAWKWPLPSDRKRRRADES